MSMLQKTIDDNYLSQYRKPVVSIFSKDDSGIHNTETRCPICKSFVAVDV